MAVAVAATATNDTYRVVQQWTARRSMGSNGIGEERASSIAATSASAQALPDAADMQKPAAAPVPAPVMFPTVGTMTGYAQVVPERITDAHISRGLTKFLMRACVRAFGTAGWQQRAGSRTPGACCDFSLSEWAEEMGLARQYVYQLRKEAEALHFLTYEPYEADPTRGRLRWNLDFTQWTALSDEHRRARYSRSGAGRPKSHALRPPASEEKSNALQKESNTIRPPAETESNAIRTPADDEIKRFTHARSKAAQEAARGGAVRNDPREEYREEEISAPTRASTPPVLAAATSQKAPTAPTPKPKVARERKITVEDEQYRHALLDRIAAVLGHTITDFGREWRYAGVAYKEGADPDAILDCFTLTLKAPRFDTGEPSLAHLFADRGYFRGYSRVGREEYIAGIARSRNGADGKYDVAPPTGGASANGHRPAPAPARTLRTVAAASPYRTEGPLSARDPGSSPGSSPGTSPGTSPGSGAPSG